MTINSKSKVLIKDNLNIEVKSYNIEVKRVIGS